ncbi:MAG: PorT family protein, partial [Paludibacteraceae bacterium]|nr:PorT family protein [Paludibacteraceae bacterium]
MKKITLFLAMALATLSVSAQGVKVGAEFGYDCVIETAETGESGSLDGLHVGPVFHFGFNENLGIKSGLLYHYAADGAKAYGVRTSVRMHTLQIPVQFAYTYNFNDNFGLYGFAGPKFDVGVALFNRTKNNDGKVYKYNDYTGKEKYDGKDISGKDPEG